MNEQRFERLIASAWNLLLSYYEHPALCDPLEFVKLTDTSEARVLIEESPETSSTWVAIEFPSFLKSEINHCGVLEANNLSIVCEEISHFFHYSHAAEHELSISIMELEMRAEIDRFLCFMHWNDFYPQLKLGIQHENCRDLCDSLFEQRFFKIEKANLYRDAESMAFHHIKNAFSHCWTKRWLDTSRFDPLARQYFMNRMRGERSHSMTA